MVLLNDLPATRVSVPVAGVGISRNRKAGVPPGRPFSMDGGFVYDRTKFGE